MFKPGLYKEDIEVEQPELDRPDAEELDIKRRALKQTWRTDIDREHSLVYYKLSKPSEFTKHDRLKDIVIDIIKRKEWGRKFPWSYTLQPAGWLYYHLTRFLRVKEESIEGVVERIIKTKGEYNAWREAIRARNQVVTSIRELFTFLEWPRRCPDPPKELVEQDLSIPVLKRESKKKRKTTKKRKRNSHPSPTIESTTPVEASE